MRITARCGKGWAAETLDCLTQADFELRFLFADHEFSPSLPPKPRAYKYARETVMYGGFPSASTLDANVIRIEDRSREKYDKKFLKQTVASWIKHKNNKDIQRKLHGNPRTLSPASTSNYHWFLHTLYRNYLEFHCAELQAYQPFFDPDQGDALYNYLHGNVNIFPPPFDPHGNIALLYAKLKYAKSSFPYQDALERIHSYVNQIHVLQLVAGAWRLGRVTSNHGLESFMPTRAKNAAHPNAVSDGRFCPLCWTLHKLEFVETEIHTLFKCSVLKTIRGEFIESMNDLEPDENDKPPNHFDNDRNVFNFFAKNFTRFDPDQLRQMERDDRLEAISTRDQLINEFARFAARIRNQRSKLIAGFLRKEGVKDRWSSPDDLDDDSDSDTSPQQDASDSLSSVSAYHFLNLPLASPLPSPVPPPPQPRPEIPTPRHPPPSPSPVEPAPSTPIDAPKPPTPSISVFAMDDADDALMNETDLDVWAEDYFPACEVIHIGSREDQMDVSDDEDANALSPEPCSNCDPSPPGPHFEQDNLVLDMEAEHRLLLLNIGAPPTLVCPPTPSLKRPLDGGAPDSKRIRRSGIKRQFEEPVPDPKRIRRSGVKRQFEEPVPPAKRICPPAAIPDTPSRNINLRDHSIIINTPVDAPTPLPPCTPDDITNTPAYNIWRRSLRPDETNNIIRLLFPLP